jgi:O-acetyl-ADP-ribose deacetylase (regulator of RNase III)
MPLTIVRNDIMKLDADAIVNAANTALQMGGGVCGAIFAAAGAEKLQAACDELAPIKVGEAVITPGFGLTAKYVIHAAGPIYRGGAHGEEKLLRACYRNSLNLAREKGCESVAFPLISSGIYGYPKDKALSAATSEIGQWLSESGNDMDVSLVVFDKASFAVGKKLLGEIEAFIDDNYTGPYESAPRREHHARMAIMDVFSPESLASMAPGAPVPLPPSEPEDFIGHLDEPFSTALLRLIDAKGKTEVEVYKRANIDRKLFSKIRTASGYMPGKRTALALAVALELTPEETGGLLRRAGFALSRSIMSDVIVEYFISRGRYDIYEINNVLFEYDQPTLGG